MLTGIRQIHMFLLTGIMFVAVSGSTHAATFNVGCGPTRVADLIAAINGANATAADDTINLTANCVYTLTLADNATDGGNGLPVIAAASTGGSLTIQGNGATIERDSAAPLFRLILIGAGANATLDQLTVRGGNTTVKGGAIRNLGVLLVQRSTVANNASDIGGGIDNEGTLRTLDCTVNNNYASIGGGIATEGAGSTTILTQTTITANTNAGSGGGVYVGEGVAGVFITSSTIANNQAGFGGGISAFSAAPVVLHNTIVAGNRQDFNQTGGAVSDCAGLSEFDGDYNIFGQGTGCTSGPNSLFIDPASIFTTVLSQTLANNGGPTQTLALVRGSRALGAGSSSFLSEAAAGFDYNGDGDTADALVNDQRGAGFPRVVGSAVDIGAFEAGCPSFPYVVAGANPRDLVFAVDCANTNGPGTNDVIELTQSTYSFDAVNNSVDGNNALPNIASVATAGTLAIHGNGSTLAGSGGAFRLLHVGNGANLSIDNVMISGGAASLGAGVYNHGTLTMYASTVSANSASGNGGGVWSDSALTLTNGTVSGNSADNGGGIYLAGGTLVVTNSTLASNSAATAGGGIASGGGSLTLRNDIVAGNQAGGSNTSGTADCNASGTGDYNLFGSGTGCSIGANSVTVAPASVMATVLDPTLAYNSGPTPTHALRIGSPAIDKGSNSFLNESATGTDYNGDGDTTDSLVTDQRGPGFPRVFGATVDIGSFESQSCPAFPYTVAASDTPALIHAIDCANANSTDDVIHLTNSTYVVSYVNHTNDGDNGLPAIASAATAGTLTIEGHGATIQRAPAARAFRLLRMGASAHLILNNATLANSAASGSGGAIKNENGVLALNNSSVSNSTAGNHGGGIYSVGTLTLTGTTVSNNAAINHAGGIYSDGVATITGGAISGNHAGFDDLTYGGGVYSAAGTLALTGTTISQNQAARGGGVFSVNRVTLVNCTLSGNHALSAVSGENFGGGLYNDGVADVTLSSINANDAEIGGGGVYTQGTLTLNGSLVADNTAGDGAGLYNQGALRVANSTISGNSATFNGGGLYNTSFATASVLTNATIVNNHAVNNNGGIDNASSLLTVNNSIIAGNQAGGSSTKSSADCGGGTIGGDYNLYGSATGCSIGAHSVTVDPSTVFTTVVEPARADHGGPTQSYMLRSGSPAINAGSTPLAVDANGIALPNDQRDVGYPRSIGTSVDIGSIEFLPSAPTLSATKNVSGTFEPGKTVTYTIVITNSGTGAQADNPGDEFVDVLPSALTLIGATASSGTALATIATRTVTWNGAIPVGGSVTITITASINAVAAGTSVSNQGTVHYDADGNGTNETSLPTDDPSASGTANATVFVVTPPLTPTLSATKTVGGVFAPGKTVTYAIVITNSGTGAQADNPGDEFVDVLPGELTLIGAMASSGTALATIATRTVTWNGAIPVGGSVTITITASINAVAPGTSVSNQGTVHYDADGNGTNETSLPTDDPSASGPANATVFFVTAPPAPIPAPLDPIALLALALMLAVVAVTVKR